MSVLSEHFSGHLQELRRRLLISLGALVGFSAVAYLFSPQIARFFISPLFRAHPELGTLVYTNLTEAFLAYLKLALLVGLVFSFPVLLFQLWMFISPGLHRHERRLAFKVAGVGALLFAAGAVFAYWVILPVALSFLMGFAGEQLVALPKLDAYLTFVVRASLAFGLAFQTPFLMVMANRAGLVPRRYFIRKRMYFYAAIAVLSFFLAAGDLFSAVLLTIPLLTLYEGGMVVMRLFPPAEQPSSPA
jgi:sec-independent protein translocase protein TatC